MLNIKGMVSGLSDDLLQVEQYMDTYIRLEEGPPAAADILDAVTGSKGKKIRPILLLLCGRLGKVSTEQRERMCKLAALVEMVHMASLVHDDIVDDSPLRRGRATVQSQFGKHMAVYTGDFILSRVLYYLFREDMCRAGMMLGHTVEEMWRGEVGQYSCRYDTETTMEAYLRNVYGKTAALFRMACELGGIESGFSEKRIKLLGDLGEHLGYLFQLRDDLLDFLSSEQQAGKPIHQDFVDGVYTMPVLYALENAKYGGRLREIAQQTADGKNSSALLAEMQRIVTNCGGIAYTCDQIQQHVLRVRRILIRLPQNEASVALSRLVQWLGDMKPIHVKTAS